MVTRKQHTSKFGEVTGRAWEDWIVFLDGIGARDLTHTEIARRIEETGLASGWWGQGITVAYEQHIGRRQPGQTSSGAFAVSVTRTLTGTADECFARWRSLMEQRTVFDGVAMSGTPTISVTPKRHYWRCSLKDGSRVIVALEPKGVGQTLLAVSHEKLTSADEVERWRAFWKAAVAEL